ncbi:MAG: sigma 54-interacting transcriptional regulator [Desulfitobacteriaceae bacterium]
MKVRDLMSMEFPLLIPQQSIILALSLLADWEVSAAPVLDRFGNIGVFMINGQVLKYILNERDKNPHLLVKDFMSIGIPVAREEQTIASIPVSFSPVIPVINDKERLSGVLWVQRLASYRLDQAQFSGNEISNDELNTIMQSVHDGIVIADEIGKEYVATAIPVFNQDGDIQRVVTNIRDITELVELKDALEDTKVQAAEFSSNLALVRTQHMLEHGIVSKSPQMLQIIDLASKMAQFDATVLILGESGVGKELIAKLIHSASTRNKKGEFIKVNCGAIPRELLESEFFGYEPGAFTGARKEGKPGYFELAHTGTLFLDEIGELPLDLQVKLLRVIQEHELVRLGDTKPKKIDVRIIAATNRELEQMVAQGTFREDLFYRLNVLPIQIPPLRSRPEDIPALLTAFLEKYSRKYGSGKMFTGDSLALLCRYNWPGNVRELENVVERLVITADDHVILPQHLPIQVLKREQSASVNNQVLADHKFEHDSEMRTLQEVMDQVEKEMIIKALTIYGSTYRAAKVLGVSQSTIVRKAKKYHQKTERFWHEDEEKRGE